MGYGWGAGGGVGLLQVGGRRSLESGEYSSASHSTPRLAIQETAAHFGCTLKAEQIAAAKAEGNANNDWKLTHRLIRASRVNGEPCPSLEEVTNKFEDLYQGVPGSKGLCEVETLIPPRVRSVLLLPFHGPSTNPHEIPQGLLEELSRRVGGRMGIVTGRPRNDCAKFLKKYDLESLFPTCVCMEDGPPKPDPHPVLLCAQKMGVDPSCTILIGDTPDDISAAIAAGGRGLGVLTPEDQAKVQTHCFK